MSPELDEWQTDIDDNGHPTARCPDCNSNEVEIESDPLTFSYRWACLCGAVSEWS